MSKWQISRAAIERIEKRIAEAIARGEGDRRGDELMALALAVMEAGR